jgi:ADP-ribose pyrophosphatase
MHDDVVRVRREARLDAYDELRRDRPELFANPPGAAFEILFDRAAQLEITEQSAHEYAELGIPTDFADIGVVYRDKYLIAVRDAVRFRSGDVGPYVRTIPATGAGGVAILPLLPDGRVIIVSHFRHETRSWHWEIPRGFRDQGESAETCAVRELAEEIGTTGVDISYLGSIQSGGADLDMIFAGSIDTFGPGDAVEGIDDVKALTMPELTSKISSGDIDDSYLLAALAFGTARGILRPTGQQTS